MKLKAVLSFCAAMATAVVMAAADAPATEGAELGKWTMDIVAAKELAAKTGKPMFWNFTGSDWCGWCQLMDKNVFSKDAWKAYAQDNLVLVWIDFPKKKERVPEAYAARNRELAEKYQVQGFPTYFVFAADGETVLGQLNADPAAKPEDFATKVDRVIAKASIETLLSAEDLAIWTALDAEEKALKDEVTAFQKRVREEGKAYDEKQRVLTEKRNALLDKAVKASVK